MKNLLAILALMSLLACGTGSPTENSTPSEEEIQAEETIKKIENSVKEIEDEAAKVEAEVDSLLKSLN